MTETEKIENLLRHPPRLKLPGGLRETLRAGIVLPRRQSHESRQLRPWLRRWLPALAFSAFFLACVVALAVQSSLLSELRRENESLRAATQDLDRLRQENVEYQKLRSENQQLDQLRKDNLEVQKLRDEVARLRGQLQELPSLQADNQRLLAEKKLAENRLPADAQREEDPFDAAQKRAERITCISNIKQIGLAARMWARDHHEAPLPTDFITMRGELNSPKVLICPGDTKRSLAQQLGEVTQLANENSGVPKLRLENKEMESLREANQDLLKLRNEVRQVRDGLSQWTRLRQENQHLESEIKLLSDGKPLRLSQMDGYVAKESWSNAGFATPEAAVETFFWAVREGRFQQIAECLSPDERSGFEHAYRQKPEAERARSFQEGLLVDKFGGYRVTQKEQGLQEEAQTFSNQTPVPDPERVVLGIQAAAGGAVMKWRLKRFGNEWKIDEWP